jgi:hypothetical protein
VELVPSVFMAVVSSGLNMETADVSETSVNIPECITLQCCPCRMLLERNVAGLEACRAVCILSRRLASRVCVCVCVCVRACVREGERCTPQKLRDR